MPRPRYACVCLLALLLLASALPALAVERSAISDDYKWKTEHIYADVAAWQADVDAIAAGLDRLAAFKGSFAGDKATNPVQSLIEFNHLALEIGVKFERVGPYVGYNYAVDMSNTDWMGRQQMLANLGVQYNQKLAWVEPELLQIPKETLMKWVNANPELEPYRKQYQDMYLLQEHTLSEKEEEILALSGNITNTAADVFGKMTNVDMTFGWILDENGDSVQVTDEGWTSWRTNKDRRVREDYFTAVWDQYKAYENTFAALMAGNLKKDVYLTRARKYDNTLQRALSSSFIPVEVYTNLVTTTRANVAPLHKYNAIRKRVLGFDHYRHWDYYVSLAEGAEVRYTWPQAVAMVTDALKPMGSAFVADVSTALDAKNGWVDVFANDNKRGGAFSGSAYGVHSFMLFNFDYDKGLTVQDVTTVAHEVGHSMHTWYSEKTQPYPNKDYAIFNAEVASTTLETLLSMKLLDDARAAYKKAKGKEKDAAKQDLIALLQENIDGARGSFFRQTKFATWEWEAHKLAEEGKPMTAASFNKLYGDLVREFHGPALEYGELTNVSWATVPHFYRGYYVYSYATSHAAAVAIANDIRAEAAGKSSKKGSAERFINYLKSGSSKHPVELLKDAGVDMTNPAPILSFIVSFTEMVNELDKLTAKTK